ncbi:MAG: type IX secretion system sortase PorU [Bacteroidales bacterium]|nr:type IX secretion system sortase PorU [Bacteroidales bacterium]MCF8456138.1 type IX secretion system sortase PorU [Bacteroidales bacterium]
MISNCVFAQEMNVQKAITWHELLENNSSDNGEISLFFDQQSYNSTFFPFPVYEENILLALSPEYSYSVESEIQILKSSVFQQSGHTVFKNMVGLPQVKVDIFRARDELFASIQFFPFFKNRQLGRIEKVDSFQIQLSFSKKHRIKNEYFAPKSSVLASGQWFRIAVSEDGIYKVSFDALKNIGFSSPEKCRFYGNATGQLPYMNNQAVPDDLQEIAVWVHGNAFYFYGKGPDYWKFNSSSNLFDHVPHSFSDKSYYFVSDSNGPGKRIAMEAIATLSENQHAYTYDDYFVHEKDSLNLIRSGMAWYGEHFDIQTTYHFDFYADSIIPGEKAHIRIATAARSSATYLDNFIQLDINDQIGLGKLLHVPVTYSSTDYFASKQTFNTEFYPEGDSIKVVLTYNKQDSYSEAWVDFIQLQVRRTLKIGTDQFFFRDAKSIGAGAITHFHIENASAGYSLWDITDHQNVKEINHTINGESLEFVVTTDSLRQFVVFKPESQTIKSPEFIEAVVNQDLHTTGPCDLLILSAKEYHAQAEELAALHREEGLSVCVVTPQLIYNEFSSGMPDVSAIRNFVRHQYFSYPDSLKIRYLLLYGDGSYDMRPGFFDRQKLLPAFQSANSLLPTESFISDDFYGLLDYNEGEASGFLDIGIGRLPVSSVAEAEIVLGKIKDYQNKRDPSGWMQDLLFVADNGNGNLHLDQAETLTAYVETTYPQFNIKKVYFDAYPYEANKPNRLAKEDINRSVDKGALIVNYTGHGSELGLGSDNVVTVGDILSWDNAEKLNVFMTATCEFSRFDDNRRTSAGELILLNPYGGGVALFTTTRLVYSTPNFILNQNFYKYIFEQSDEGNRLGDVMRNTKVAAGQGINKRNFSLLGDPALMLAMPSNQIRLTTINEHGIENLTDTFYSFSKLHVSGQIESNEGAFLDDFNGELEARIYDQKNSIQTMGENESLVTTFEQFENIIFKGKVSVVNGQWAMEFLLPADISKAVGMGKMSFYAKSENSSAKDAGGRYSDFLITGNRQAELNDKTGPQVRIFLNDENYSPGDKVGPMSTLLILLTDSSGINTTGHAIGRNLTAWIDGQKGSPINLNDYYEAELDNFREGKVNYEIGPLAEGIHNIMVKAWDIANNPTEAQIDFEVSSLVVPEITHVFNYPNPFTQSTSFYFEHNLAGLQLDVSIDIYTVSGKLVRRLESVMLCESGLSDPVFWDGLDNFGNKIGRSVYFYRLRIATEQGFKVEKIEKLVSLK